MTATAALTAISLSLVGCGTEEPAQPPVATIEHSSDRPGVNPAPPGRVNVYRDRFGVAHLYAEREEDGLWGHGYTAAENFLEGILLYYLSVKGELARAFGPGPCHLTGC